MSSFGEERHSKKDNYGYSEGPYGQKNWEAITDLLFDTLENEKGFVKSFSDNDSDSDKLEDLDVISHRFSDEYHAANETDEADDDIDMEDESYGEEAAEVTEQLLEGARYELIAGNQRLGISSPDSGLTHIPVVQPNSNFYDLVKASPGIVSEVVTLIDAPLSSTIIKAANNARTEPRATENPSYILKSGPFDANPYITRITEEAWFEFLNRPSTKKIWRRKGILQPTAKEDQDSPDILKGRKKYEWTYVYVCAHAGAPRDRRDPNKAHRKTSKKSIKCGCRARISAGKLVSGEGVVVRWNWEHNGHDYMFPNDDNIKIVPTVNEPVSDHTKEFTLVDISDVNWLKKKRSEIIHETDLLCGRIEGISTTVRLLDSVEKLAEWHNILFDAYDKGRQILYSSTNN
ncbi:hypothetical protein V1511DRAFT_502136 [Dipodascopsis uninucleata]